MRVWIDGVERLRMLSRVVIGNSIDGCNTYFCDLMENEETNYVPNLSWSNASGKFFMIFNHGASTTIYCILFEIVT